MKFISKEIEDAYYASPLPLESYLNDSERYHHCIKELTAQHEQLHAALSPEQYRLAQNIFDNIGTQLDIEGMFYFQSGWLAAKNNTG